jgi:hypothetical protein
MDKKTIGIVLLVVGVVLIGWGYSIADSVSGQLSSAFSGSPGDKAMILYIAGGICAAIGIFRLVK